MEDFKGIFIPKEIWFNEDLNMIEKVMVSHWEVLKTYSNPQLSTFFNISTHQCSKYKNSLIKRGYVTPSVKKLKDYKEIKEEVLRKRGNSICEWCGACVHVLCAHHYPIPKRDGGTEVVHICSNCHMDFHALEVK